MADTAGVVGAKVVIDGDTSGLRAALSSARSSLSSFQSQALGALQRVDKATGDLATTLASLRSTADLYKTAFNVIGLGGAVAGVYAALRHVHGIAKAWADIGESARERGVTVETLDEIKYAAQRMGTSFGTVLSSLEKFRVKVASLRVEGSGAAASLAGFNKPLLDAIRKSKDQREALRAVADSMASSKDATEQIRLATVMFGAENVSMIHTLGRGSKSLDVWAKSARNAGQVMDGETTAAANRLTHALNDVGKSPAMQWVHERLVDATNQLAVAMGSEEAMNTAELEHAAKTLDAQIKRLEESLKRGAQSGDEVVGAWDSIRWAARGVGVDFANAYREVVIYLSGADDEVKGSSKKLAELNESILRAGDNIIQINGGASGLDILKTDADEAKKKIDDLNESIRISGDNIIQINGDTSGLDALKTDVYDSKADLAELNESIRRAGDNIIQINGGASGLDILKNDADEAKKKLDELNESIRLAGDGIIQINGRASKFSIHAPQGPGLRFRPETQEYLDSWFSSAKESVEKGNGDLAKITKDGTIIIDKSAKEGWGEYLTKTLPAEISAAFSGVEQEIGAAFGDVDQAIEKNAARLAENMPDKVVATPAKILVAKRVDELKQARAEIEELLASRRGWKAMQESIDLKDAEKYKAPEPPDTTAADKWAHDLHGQMLGATQDYYAQLAAKRDDDLAKFDEYVESLGEAWEGGAQARLDIEAKYQAEMRKLIDKDVQPFTSAISSDLDRAFSDWVDKGEMSWEQLSRNILADIIKIQVRMAVLQPLFGGGSAGGTGVVGGLIGDATKSVTSGIADLFSAKGNVFDSGRVIPFARGGVVDRPSIFGMRDGQTGLMGEAGPEGILPLARGRDGRLGVRTTGGGQSINVNFTVNAADTESFRRSEGQVTAMLRRAVSRGNRSA